ncbi:MAG: Fur family transcriptional regulator [Candidatus Rokuibacteriota bacterium]
MIPKRTNGPSSAPVGASLRACGLRLTRPRRLILEVVRATAAHPSAAVVYARVRRLLPRVSLGTVYRNLRRLAAEGLLQERAEPEELRFDGNTTPHAGRVGGGQAGRLAHGRPLRVSGPAPRGRPVEHGVPEARGQGSLPGALSPAGAEHRDQVRRRPPRHPRGRGDGHRALLSRRRHLGLQEEVLRALPVAGQAPLRCRPGSRGADGGDGLPAGRSANRARHGDRPRHPIQVLATAYGIDDTP